MQIRQWRIPTAFSRHCFQCSSQGHSLTLYGELLEAFEWNTDARQELRCVYGELTLHIHKAQEADLHHCQLDEH